MAGLLSLWITLTPFWHFQILGWAVFVLATFPLKWDLGGSFPSALLLCVSRDGVSFALTLALRMVYRALWSSNGIAMGVVFVTACSIAGVIQAGTTLILRDFMPECWHSRISCNSHPSHEGISPIGRKT